MSKYTLSWGVAQWWYICPACTRPCFDANTTKRRQEKKPKKTKALRLPIVTVNIKKQTKKKNKTPKTKALCLPIVRLTLKRLTTPSVKKEYATAQPSYVASGNIKCHSHFTIQPNVKINSEWIKDPKCKN
jgi:hypothetical protein